MMETSEETAVKPHLKDLFLFPAGRANILSVSGGGYRGLFAARVLQRFEDQLRHDGLVNQAPLADHFRLCVGTSVGGLIAAAIALKVPASELVELFQIEGPSIFQRTKKPRPGDQRRPRVRLPFLETGIDLKLFGAPYRHTGLENAIKKVLRENAEKRLSEIDEPFAVVAVSYTHARPVIFRTRGLDRVSPSEVSLLDALIASASAPTYFPARTISWRRRTSEMKDASGQSRLEAFTAKSDKSKDGKASEPVEGEDILIDGGIIANTPDLVGITEAIGRLFCDPLDLHMLSIGTAGEDQSGGLENPKSSGGINWITKHKLLAKLMASQEVLAQDLAKVILGTRYQRIDQRPPKSFSEHIREMDDYSSESTKALLALADRSWEKSLPKLMDAGLVT